MKVYLSNYRDHWISPYTIIEYAFFWTAWSKCGRRKDFVSDSEFVDHPKWVNSLADRIEWVSIAIKWVLDHIHPKIDYVKVDGWDAWSADHTLAQVILPTLKMLRDNKCAYAMVSDEDVPEHIRSTAPGARDGIGNDYDWDNHAEARWNYVLDEMIFAFECKVDDTWENQFHTGEYDRTKVPGEPGWEGTSKFDGEGYKKFHSRISNGFCLFGKYYEALWW